MAKSKVIPTNPMFERLFMAERDWDICLILVQGRPPFGLEPSTDVRYSIDPQSGIHVLSFTDPNTPDPLFDPNPRNFPPNMTQTEIMACQRSCEVNVNIRVSEIRTVDYIRYNKIIEKPNLIVAP